MSNRFAPRLPLATSMLCAALLVFGPERVARAQPGQVPQPSAAAAEADRLFQRATERMDGGDFNAACPLFEQSHAADPSSGTLLNLGDCYEHLGRSASADAAFAQAVDLAKRGGHPDRVEVGELRRARLAPSLRRFQLRLPPEPASVEVRVDNKTLDRAGEVFAVDPGVHVVRATAPGYRDYVVELAAPEPGATLEVNVPALERDVARVAPSAPPTESPSRPRSSSARQVAIIASGAIGVAGVVTGAVFGLRSMSKHNESDDYCDDSRCRDERGVEAMDSARAAGNVSTVAFIVGAVGLGAAGVLWFARPADNNAGFQAGIAPGSIRFGAKF